MQIIIKLVVDVKMVPMIFVYYRAPSEILWDERPFLALHAMHQNS